MINLRHRYIEAVAETIFQALDYVALFFQRVRTLNVYVESQNRDDRRQC